MSRTRTEPAAVTPADLGIGRLFWKMHEAVIAANCATGRIVLWNPAAEAIFGYSATEALDQPLEIIIPEHLRDRHRAGLNAFCATGRGALVESNTPLEVPALHRDGDELIIELTLLPVEDAPRPGRFILAIIRNFNERRRMPLAESTLIEREQTARAAFLAARRQTARILNSISDAFFTLDRNWRITHINRAAEELFQRPRASLLGRNIWDEYPPARSTIFETEFRRARTEGINVSFEAPIPHLAAWVEATAYPDAEGLSVFLRNITERRRAESEQLQRAREQEFFRSRNEILSTVSHDLKNPLAVIKGTAQTLRRRIEQLDLPDSSRLISGLERIDSVAARMTRLLNELRDVTRLRIGEALILERRPTDLVGLVARLVDEYQRSADEHPFHFHSPRELIGEWDALRLERVVTNLLQNALKYSPTGGAIEVTLDQVDLESGPAARLSVTDHGLGIPEADLPQIFERFFRASNVVDQIEGTGLGLAGARQIVEQHGGTIAVRSQAGRGSTFIVCLPLQFDESAAERAASRFAPEASAPEAGSATTP